MSGRSVITALQILRLCNKKRLNFFATLYRAGYNWVECVINVAYNLDNGGDGEYFYQGNAPKDIWQFRNLNIIAEATYINQDNALIFHTHKKYSHLLNLSLSHDTKVVVLIRDFFNYIESCLFWSGYDKQTQNEFLKESNLVDNFIDFSNTWGRFLDKNKDNSMLLKYEEIIDNPIRVISNLSTFWNLDLSHLSIETAVEKCNKLEMSKHVPNYKLKENARISVRKDRGNVFTKGNIRFMKNKLNSSLNYHFGYNYEKEKEGNKR